MPQQQIAENLERAFAQKGFAEPSVAELKALSGVSMRTLYKYFPSKESMVVGALDYRHQRYLSLLESCHSAPGLAATLSAFDTLSHWMRQNAPKGCLSANALAAFPDNAEIHSAVETYKHAVIQQLAQISGREDLSQALYVLHEGITAAYPILGEAAVSAAKTAVNALFTATTSNN
ncbi:hypothetical protein VSAK1_19674 [Vibrio mediterranei AK1]|uniref:TetR/AcrR family transcriptional regulator n=1 Tax=Vibrio TaxID=662 RepID=UPI0001540E2C|nr:MULTISPECIES: TetR/AcrR family transcriptional regulator [Vibrio]EDL55185.1 hypothetical protein VSAK1_19674 [Vibrio mediterranei AK1]MDA0108855.1 TetR/AcrR family transcriptional regulator [Vibrio sp. La 4.2.2]